MAKWICRRGRHRESHSGREERRADRNQLSFAMGNLPRAASVVVVACQNTLGNLGQGYLGRQRRGGKVMPVPVLGGLARL